MHQDVDDLGPCEIITVFLNLIVFNNEIKIVIFSFPLVVGKMLEVQYLLVAKNCGITLAWRGPNELWGVSSILSANVIFLMMKLSLYHAMLLLIRKHFSLADSAVHLLHTESQNRHH